MKSFDVPIIYRSPLITAIKKKRKEADKLKKDFSPTLLDLGNLQIYLARHFGFCYGVENAIEIAFKTVDENPDKRIFLLSEIIHNPQVNEDLKAHGVQFMQDTFGKQIIQFDNLQSDDVVIIPAFGTTLETEKLLNEKGIHTEKYNTTCPFVEKVWNRSEAIAKKDYTIVIHGKPRHEETRATFSHASLNAPAIVIKDMCEAKELALYISGEKPPAEFYKRFDGQYSKGFDTSKHLQRIGVVNQTTMLASDTQAIADFLKEVIIKATGDAASFADTRDTLCYATNENQGSVNEMLQHEADLAIVVGGYNSSNTSHLVELCEEKLSTYFINNEEKILSKKEILHYNFHTKEELSKVNWFPETRPVKILLTSGASCPDALVEGVINKLVNISNTHYQLDEIINTI
ncbi:MAG TPA: 4-hydroxy-3-methylbut-2-enyl diphosphate reductase [Chitinophagaceae bacterium]|nr:4-hydroxy-3-methylbut-2-enyl diphosphate reductase [Chitinophagaceae bacterium]